MTGPSAMGRRGALGSLFGKTLRDSRRATVAVGLLAGLFMIAAAAPMALEFGTLALRRVLSAQMELLPVVLRGLLGDPIAIDTLGGFMSWRVGNIMPVMLGIWSVVALSGTLAGEAARGSLDLLVATPLGRRRIALEKVGGHVVALVVAMLVASLITVVAGVVFRTLPGDEITIEAALGHFALTGLLVLAAGSVAFAASPILGRTRAAGLGFVALFGGYLIASYASLSGLIRALEPLSWYSWTAGHRPLAGTWDWPTVALLAAVCVGLLAVGVVAFERRDVGVAVGAGRFALPGLPSGVGGPFRRQLADRTAIALAWGVGLGAYGAVIAASAEEFASVMANVPGMTELIKRIYPAIDIGQPSGLLQLTFFSFGTLMIGLAGASLLAGWASDEERRRLDVVLAAPLSRARWAARSGAAILAAIAITAAVNAAFVAAATSALGFEALTATLGMTVVGLYGMAFAGVGLAVGGLVRPTLAAPVTAGLVIASFLLELLGNALNLPDVIVDLSLNRHLGQPIAGSYDPFGIIVGLGLAVGGLLLGAWGLTRRDLRG